jgi:hypothetical protein
MANANSPAAEHAERIAEALRGRAFETAEALWNAIQSVHRPMRWESAALAEMVWQKLGADADTLRADWRVWRYTHAC